MTEATVEATVTPREMGKHLREIRRKKGLSLSEVARGAGLSRRELANYERGKVPIPESDLWVLAGSCGVDVSELVPTKSQLSLEAPSSIGDSIAMLRRSQDDAEIGRYLGTLRRLQATPDGAKVPIRDRELAALANALGSDPSSIEAKLTEVLAVGPDEAARLRSLILPPVGGRRKARALAAGAPDPAGAVDIFEELASLPEPAPLTNDPIADFLADSAPTVSGAPIDFSGLDPATFASPQIDPVPVPEPVLVDLVADRSAPHTTAADAPPIDVATRAEMLVDGATDAPPTEAFSGSSFVPPPLDTGAVDSYFSNLDPSPGSSPAWPEPAPPTPAGDLLDGDPHDHEGTIRFDDGFDDGLEEPAAVELPTAADATAPSTPFAGPGSPGGSFEEMIDPDPVPTSAWPGAADFWTSPGDESATDATSAAALAWLTEPRDEAQAQPGDPTFDEHDDADSHGGLWEPFASGIPDSWQPDVAHAGRDLYATTDDLFSTSALPGDDVAAPAEDPADPFAAFGRPFDADEATWALHEPDPAATDSGFLVDWGTATDGSPDTAPSPAIDDTPLSLPSRVPGASESSWLPSAAELALAAFTAAEAAAGAGAAADADADVDAESFQGVETVHAGDLEAVAAPVEPEPEQHRPELDELPEPELSEPELSEPSEPELPEPCEPELPEPSELDEPAPISWRPEPLLALDAVASSITPEPAEAAPPALPAETFRVAGDEWELGNALPLVEIRGSGSLVMRRADERWALADLMTTERYTLEVDVEFRSGPGFGVLFRADVDADGRMSGYSFDVDPVYDGGGYLVRQWQADRELWNPIARVSAPDPSSMYGTFTVRLAIDDEHLVASVNGVEVLTIDNLKQASADRGRDAANGRRVGVQAWSSSDLVIDTVRVADR